MFDSSVKNIVQQIKQRSQVPEMRDTQLVKIRELQFKKSQQWQQIIDQITR